MCAGVGEFRGICHDTLIHSFVAPGLLRHLLYMYIYIYICVCVCVCVIFIYISIDIYIYIDIDIFMTKMRQEELAET